VRRPCPRRDAAAEGGPSRGRPFDVDLDEAILDAAVALLTEIGYERMTMDAVAARARVSKATIYRRWDSKASLVVDAMRFCNFAELELPETPDLRSDLLVGLQCFRAAADGQDAGLYNGVMTAMRHDPELARLVRERMIGHKQQMARTWLQSYVDRGMLPADTDIDLFHQVGLAMVGVRLVITGEPVDDAFLEHVVDDVLLPLLLRGGTARRASDPAQPAPERTTV
jgi:AcrR family transcriptional regulator